MRCAFRWALFLPACLMLMMPAFAADEKKSDKPETKPETKPTVKEKDPDKDKFVPAGQMVGRLTKIEDGGKYFSLRVQVREPYLGGNGQIAYRNKDVDVPMQFGENCKVRLPNPPPAFDDKGNPKKYSGKELRELRGNQPGYPGDFTNLKNDQVVQVNLIKPKAPPRNAKTTSKKDKDKGEMDALTENRALASMIIILAEPMR